MFNTKKVNSLLLLGKCTVVFIKKSSPAFLYYSTSRAIKALKIFLSDFNKLKQKITQQNNEENPSHIHIHGQRPCDEIK